MDKKEKEGNDISMLNLDSVLLAKFSTIIMFAFIAVE
jgi:hypothetical protein